MDPWHDSSAQDTRLDLESYCWGRLKKVKKLSLFCVHLSVFMV
jgi:hypothetical protein